MARLLKCYGTECTENNLKYPKDELFEYGGKNYCFKHYQQKLKDKEDRIRLYGIIKKYFNIPYPTGLMLGQIKKFQNINNYTLEGMADAIEYMSSLSWVVLDSKKGLGLVPYVYDDAQEEKLRKQNQTQLNSKEVVVEQEITVNKDKFKKENKVVNNKKKFDFGA